MLSLDQSVDISIDDHG